VDRSRDNFVIFETAAILLYLADHYDTEKKFTFDPKTSPNDYSEVIQWSFFIHGGIGPMQVRFQRTAKCYPVELTRHK
jgi:glutathione S-transferase